MSATWRGDHLAGMETFGVLRGTRERSADSRVPGRVVGLNPSEPPSVADIQVPGRVTVRVVLGDDQLVPL